MMLLMAVVVGYVGLLGVRTGGVVIARILIGRILDSDCFVHGVVG